MERRTRETAPSFSLGPRLRRNPGGPFDPPGVLTNGCDQCSFGSPAFRVYWTSPIIFSMPLSSIL
jgi:hypothetical protein